MNFVFVSLQRINTDRESTSTSLAKELSKNHHVLYVNSPIDRKTLYSKNYDTYTRNHVDSIKKNESGLTIIHSKLAVLNPPSIIESINWIPVNSVFNFFNKMNNARFAKDIKRAIDQIGFKSYILINDKDIFRSFYLKELLKPELYIYLDRDNTVATDYWRRHGTILEPLLIKKSDGVVCNSPAFQSKALKYNKNSFYIGNGYDSKFTSMQNEQTVPIELKDLKGPVIGYVGALISMRLDVKLFKEIARTRKKWNIVLIGPDDNDFRESGLYEYENVHYLGKKHTEEVPQYLKYCDVCINPQLVNEITVGNFPLKIVEYLAMGKPVVATETPTMKEIFADQVYLAKNGSDYVQQIENALMENSEERSAQRIAFSKQFTWEEITKNLLNSIQEILMRSAKRS